MLLAQWIRIRTSSSIDDPVLDQDPILVPTQDPIPDRTRVPTPDPIPDRTPDPVRTRERPSRNCPLISRLLPASDGLRLAICLPFGRQMATSW